MSQVRLSGTSYKALQKRPHDIGNPEVFSSLPQVLHLDFLLFESISQGLNCNVKINLVSEF